MSGAPQHPGGPQQHPPTTGTHQTVGGEGERLEGLRAWVAQLDRKLGTRTYAGGAALVLALAGAAVALVLTLQVSEDSATKDDLQTLREQLAGVEDSASEAAQDDLEGISERLSGLESQVSALQTDGDAAEQRLEVIEDDIEDLRSQIDSLDTGGVGITETPDGDTGGGTPGLDELLDDSDRAE